MRFVLVHYACGHHVWLQPDAAAEERYLPCLCCASDPPRLMEEYRAICDAL